ncbi:hypothetical protein BST81_09965 [Leptolyngbya sp. 'hensonii']|nr:hypothetical protein BST81_09965 [Leptolyngbya sp. 'hensonii']
MSKDEGFAPGADMKLVDPVGYSYLEGLISQECLLRVFDQTAVVCLKTSDFICAGSRSNAEPAGLFQWI